jgi:acetylornithine deacetylase/succinyl-diaminopimelate desuccinylase-like protein
MTNRKKGAKISSDYKSSKLPEIIDVIKSVRETLLANLILIGEIPAETFHEERRNQALINRFSELGLLNTSTDEKQNGVGLLPGTQGDQNILIVAHSDTVFSEARDHAISISPDEVKGPGVADNSLGVAALATLPDIFKALDIKLKNNLVLMGSSRSMGRGNMEGLRFFLENNNLPIKAGLCVEGVELGRISHVSMGMLRGEIVCKITADKEWSGFGNESAIGTMNEVINKINEIPIPRKPRCSIILGRIEGGTEFNKKAVKAKLGFEVRSESGEGVDEIGFLLEEAVAEVKSQTKDLITLDIFAKRTPGGIQFTHPLVRNARNILEQLDIKPRYEPSTSELAGLIDEEIPALTIGLTQSKALELDTEIIEVDPVYKGLAQLVALILAIDGGYADEH